MRCSPEKMRPLLWTQFLMESLGRRTCRAPSKRQLLLLFPEKPAPRSTRTLLPLLAPCVAAPKPLASVVTQVCLGPLLPWQMLPAAGAGLPSPLQGRHRPQLRAPTCVSHPEKDASQEPFRPRGPVPGPAQPTWPCRACPVLGVQPQEVWELASGTVQLLLVSGGGGAVLLGPPCGQWCGKHARWGLKIPVTSLLLAVSVASWGM